MAGADNNYPKAAKTVVVPVMKAEAAVTTTAVVEAVAVGG